MKRMKITVTTFSPIVLTTESNTTVMTETHDAITGSILRGVVAKQYIAARKLGKDAHRDDRFRSLFFGSLRFADANLACPGGRRSFVIPLSMQKEKPKTGRLEQIEDMIRTDHPTKGMKSFCGYAVLTDEGLIRQVEASTDIALHMSRMSDTERRKGRSADGGIYNYESISAGQKFIGYIVGDETALSELRADLPDSFECRIGRSKYTQYGRCLASFEEPKDIPGLTAADLEKKDGSVILRLDGPFLFEEVAELQLDASGQCVPITATRALEAVADAMNARTGSSTFHIGKVFSANVEIENYIDVWGMKRPREHGLAAGTVFSLTKEGDWTEQDFDALTDLMYRGVGRRTEEGFGQIRHWPEPKGLWARPKTSGTGGPAVLPFKKASAAVAEIAIKAFGRRIAEQLRIDAAVNAKKAVHDTKSNGLSGLTHFFNRLDGLLDDAANETGKTTGLRERYSQMLRDEIPQKGPLNANLHALRVDGRSLHDILVEGYEILYKDCPVWKLLSVNEQKAQSFMEAVDLPKGGIDLADGPYFYEYWHWFFRYARKKAVTKQKEAEIDA